MKQFKVTFLFFCIWCLFQFISCNKKEVSKTSENLVLDSVDFFIQKMRNPTLKDINRLKYSNTALQYAENLKLNSKSIEILNDKIYLLGKLKLYDSAIYTSKKLLQKSIIKNDSSYTGRAYFNLAYYYNRNSQKDSAYYFYNLLKNGYLKFNDSTTNGNILLDIAIIESDFGDYNGSDYSATQALKYLKNSPKKYAVPVYNCLAINSRKQFDYKEALHYYDLAIKNSVKYNEKIVINNNKANVYRDLKEFDKSISLLNTLLKDSIFKNTAITKARIIDNLAYTKWLANNRVDVLPNLLKALAIRQKENDLYGTISSYAHLSEYYALKNPEIALAYASKMYHIAKNQKSPQDQLKALQKLIALDNSNKAKVYYLKYVNISDSIQESRQRAKNQFAKIKYDSEKTREENLQLKIAYTAGELKLSKEKNRNIITLISGGSIVCGLLIFGYYRKQKYKQEKQTEVYKTETRIAKKIHDEVANDLVKVMNKIQYTNKPTIQVLDDIEKVYLLTRNISHQNNSIETGATFDNYLKNMLASFNNDQTTIIIKDIHKVGFSKLVKAKQVELYRILQELMVNMRKHSRATLVVISFKNNNNYYEINYADNGIGLDIEKITLKSGLKNVETRIKSINGIVNFDSALNNGFKVFIRLKK